MAHSIAAGCNESNHIAVSMQCIYSLSHYFNFNADFFDVLLPSNVLMSSISNNP